MKRLSLLALALAMATASASTWAVKYDQQDVHHPAGVAPAPAAKATPGQSKAAMARMDSQIKVMQEMHDKMMAAKTPEERSALMTEHMKAMQNGMAMMNGMSASGMPGDAATRNQMMEKRMEMMESMMQMMMDRLPAAPVK